MHIRAHIAKCRFPFEPKFANWCSQWTFGDLGGGSRYSYACSSLPPLERNLHTNHRLLLVDWLMNAKNFYVFFYIMNHSNKIKFVDHFIIKCLFEFASQFLWLASFDFVDLLLVASPLIFFDSLIYWTAIKIWLAFQDMIRQYSRE